MTLRMGKTDFDSPFNWFEDKYGKTWRDLSEDDVKILIQKEFKVDKKSSFVRHLYTMLTHQDYEPVLLRPEPSEPQIVLGKRYDPKHDVQIIVRKALVKEYYVQYRDSATGRFISKKDFVKRHG